MEMKKQYRSIKYNFIKGGLKNIYFKICIKFREAIFIQEELLIYQYASLDNFRFTADKELDVRELRFDELVTLGYEKAIYYPEAILERFKNREKCYGVFYGDLVAHIAWVTRGYLHCSLRFPNILYKDSAGIYDCITIPSFRRQGIYQYMLGYLLATYLVDSKYVYIAVHPLNKPSIRGIKRVGFSKLQRIVFTRVLFFRKLKSYILD